MFWNSLNLMIIELRLLCTFRGVLRASDVARPV